MRNDMPTTSLPSPFGLILVGAFINYFLKLSSNKWATSKRLSKGSRGPPFDSFLFRFYLFMKKQILIFTQIEDLLILFNYFVVDYIKINNARLA